MTNVSRIFNHFLAASSIAAAADLGLLDDVEQSGGELDLTAWMAKLELYEPVIRHILEALEHSNIITIHSPPSGSVLVCRGSDFASAHAEQGYFLWAVRGYADIGTRLGELSLSANRSGEFYCRDTAAIARSGAMYGNKFVDNHFQRELDDLDFECFLDIGCGSGERAIKILRSNPELHAVGIDISEAAIAEAKFRADRAGVSERIQLECVDAREVVDHAIAQPVDLAYSFFMGHDLWPRPTIDSFLNGLLDSYPNLQTLLLSDTVKNVDRTTWPTFSLGFELFHAAMGQTIPTRAEWEQVFSKSRWSVAKCIDLDVPYSVLWRLCRPESPQGMAACG